MQKKIQSSKTFSNHSQENWQSRKCDFCMYHELIFDQLQRLKQAVIIKNHRIKQLQEFITKISQMAFVKNPLTANGIGAPANINIQKVLSPKVNDSSLSFQNESSVSFQKPGHPSYFKKKFDESSGELSFSESKNTTAKFQTKVKQNWPDLGSRFQKINELKELKKELHKKMAQETENKENQRRKKTITNNRETYQQISNQFDTLRTLSQPQEQGHINSIAHSSCENSRIKEYSQRKQLNGQSLKEEKQFQRPYYKSNSKPQIQYEQQEGKNSIDIIKQYIRRLK